MPIVRLKSRTTLGALLLLATALVALPVLGAELDRIASFSAGDPDLSDTGPDIAVQPGGSFLLTWSRTGLDGILKVRSQRFDAAGRPLAPAVELWQGVGPQVVSLPDGGFVATSWFERGLGPLIPHGIGLHRLDALGRPIGGPVIVAVESDDFNNNANPRLAVAPNGSVAVVWLDPHLAMRGQFFDASLRAISDAIFLSNTDQNEIDPDVAFRADGTALVVWIRQVDEGTLQTFGRRFSATGQPLSEAFPVSAPAALERDTSPRVVALREGGWWVGGVRQPPFNPFPGINLAATWVVRLDADGMPLGLEQPLGVLDPNSSCALGTDPTGHLLLLGTGAQSISGRVFDRNGTPASNLFNLPGGGPVSLEPVVADRSSSGFLAAWSHRSPVAASDADLAGEILTPACLEGKSAACLGPDGRYGVEVTWQIGSESGTAKPLPLAGNVATFGLRNAADHDVTVLLSGPGARDLTFAATTGAAIEIRVTDKTSGAIRTFSKPPGRFASRRFPEALPSGARLRVIEITRKITTSLRDVLLNSSPRQGRLNLARGFNPALPPEPALGVTCVPTSRALCLLGGRFLAQLSAGQYPNPALAILRTDKSGAFALPRAPESPLVTLTMIDGRANNGKFWVYLGGLSPSGYKVKITDLSTGAAKTYANPVGRLESRADRTAF